MPAKKPIKDKGILLQGPLTNVVVFQGRAELTHQASQTLTKGSHELILQNISPLILTNSIRVTGSSKGSAKARINNTTTQTRYEKQQLSESTEKLRIKLKKIAMQKEDKESEIAHLQARLDHFSNLWTRFTASDSWPKRFGMGQISIKTLQEAEEFFQLNIGNLKKEITKLTRELKDINRDYQVTKNQYDHLTQGGSTIQYQDVIINVDILTPGTFTFDIKYQVQNATWAPQYDIEVQEEKAILTSLAVIQNQTQLDWDQIQLTVSTASTRPAIAEEPNPYYLDIYAPVQYAPRKEAKKRSLRGAPPPAPAAATKMYDAMEPEDGLIEDEIEVMQAERLEVGEVVVYTLPESVTIPSDNEEHAFTIDKTDLDVSREYWWDSSINDDVLEKIEAKNQDALLLPGTSRTTADGEFIGESYLELTPPESKFSIVTRVSHALKAKKKLIDRKADEGLLRKDKAIREYTYQLELENLQDKEARYTVFAVIPHSVHQKIEVNIERISPSPVSGQLGIQKWQGTIKAKAKLNFDYEFKVTYPAGEQLTPSLP